MATKSAPKPRVAVYVGGALTVGRLVGGTPIQKPSLSQALVNTQEGLKKENIVTVVAPVLVGLGASIAADKIGVNKMLAKMRAPVRV